ncbi:MAG: ATP-binding protein [Clostridia bacterium]|nr:ATP-binding protein [Clostridia bacterium]
MNKILKKAKQAIADRRFYANQEAHNFKTKALANPQFKQAYNEYVSLMIDNARRGLGENAQLLAKQKAYEDILKDLSIPYITPQHFCNKCNDCGMVDGKYCDCLIEEVNRLLREESGFLSLEEFENANFDLFDNKEYMKDLYSKMKKWCYSDFKKTLIFIAGQTGVGKTHLMKCMANELIKRHKVVSLTSSFAMHQDFVKSYSCRDLDEKQALLDKYLNAEVLFIDDLGTELRNPNITVNFLYQVLNERKLNKRPTIITSNLDLNDITDYYDERIFSRIVDKAYSVCVYIQGDDLRLKPNKKV